MPVSKFYNKDFFKKWSADMAYILGFLFADGNITKTKRGTHFVAVYSKDLPLVRSIIECLQSDHKISKHHARLGFVYRIQIGSKELFLDLVKLGLFPNKARRMDVPKNVPLGMRGHFIRGYFDGDGSVWSGQLHKKRKKKTLGLQVAFTSASFGFLNSMKNLLNYSGIVGGSVINVKDKDCGRLIFGTADALKLHGIMYNSPHKLYLPRKKLVFDRFIRLRGEDDKKCGRSSAG